MLKLTTAQLGRAMELSDRIAFCETAKDTNTGQASLPPAEPTLATIGAYIQAAAQTLPIGRDVIAAAANVEIARCHGELAAMGIQLAPPEPAVLMKAWAFDPMTSTKHAYLQRHDEGGAIDQRV